MRTLNPADLDSFDPRSEDYVLIEQYPVTPFLAEYILAAHSDPEKRNIRPRKVRSYARDMIAGEWPPNGHAIGFDKSGMIQNGHHRFTALVEAGKQNPDLVVHFDLALGLDPKTRKTHDKGVPRRYHDDLHMDGVANAGHVAALTRRLWYWDHPSGPFYILVGGKVAANLVPTDQELEAYRLGSEEKGIPSHEEEIARAVKWAQLYYKKARLSPTGLALVAVILKRINAQAAPDFLEGLVHGDNLPGDSPILAVRDKLARLDREDEDSKILNERKIASVFRSWNHWRDGTTPRSINVPRPVTNKNFPFPR